MDRKKKTQAKMYKIRSSEQAGGREQR